MRVLIGRSFSTTNFSSALSIQFGGPTPFTGGCVRVSPVPAFVGRGYRTNHHGWGLSKDVGVRAPFPVGRVTFRTVRLHRLPAIPVQATPSEKFGGSAQFTVGRVRFSPGRLVQAPATAHASSCHAQQIRLTLSSVHCWTFCVQFSSDACRQRLQQKPLPFGAQ